MRDASVLLGISGAKRNACAAICMAGDVRAVCEEERVTRVRGIGLGRHGIPGAAIDQVLATGRCDPSTVSALVVAEADAHVSSSLPLVAVEHHRAHAATAYLTSSFPRAAVLVCDSHADREVSVWLGAEGRLEDQWWPWSGPGLASLYSASAELFGFSPPGRERQLEVLAHLGRGVRASELTGVLQYGDGGVHAAPDWRHRLQEIINSERRTGREHPTDAASTIQQRIGELLLELVADIRSTLEADKLCLAGGLFYNTYFTTLVRRSGLFEDVFVPINPGNAGLAVGATLLLAREGGHIIPCVSPFLGPEYSPDAIKAVLDGCKLTYEFAPESNVLDATADALIRGQLVGWFQGRMEWGPRALGHRSILADPRSPYVLDNLNLFLAKRERWHPYGVSACEEAVPELFCGPPASEFMEYQYGLRDSERLRHVMPAGATVIRVQTVPPGRSLFRRLHERMAQATGAGILVNTSFNGFHEPIVCSPRDAVRVFYGTGLDMLVIGQFILRK